MGVVINRRRLDGEPRQLSGSVRVDYTIEVESAAAAGELSQQMASMENEDILEVVSASLEARGYDPVLDIQVTEAPQATTRMVTQPFVDDAESNPSSRTLAASPAIFPLAVLAALTALSA